MVEIENPRVKSRAWSVITKHNYYDGIQHIELLPNGTIKIVAFDEIDIEYDDDGEYPVYRYIDIVIADKKNLEYIFG